MPPKMRIQPPSYGEVRQPVSSAFLFKLERAVQAEMKRFRVSRSFVIATAVADALGVDEQPSYRRLPERKPLRLVKRA